MNVFKKLFAKKSTGKRMKGKMTIVEHNFEGKDAFWDEVMEKNLIMYVLDDEAQNAITLYVYGDSKC